MRLKNIRSRKGASMIVLITCIAFFIVLPLSLLGFEIGRYFLLITQVENVAGACALSGTGAIATIPSSASSGPGLQGLYNGCAQEAVFCLQLNSILGSAMSNNVQTICNNTLAPYVAPPTPPVGKANISISFLNQDGSWHQDLTTSGAVKMSVTISYTTKPIFSAPGLLMNLMPTETATASSTGGLPQLDVFLCFDLSGSMDDQTGVAYVNRYWDVTLGGGAGGVNYGFTANQNSNTPNTIYNQTPGIQINGTQVNALPPQNLAKCSTSLFFNEQVRCGAGSEAGQLPGGVVLVSGVPTPQPITYTGTAYGTQNPYISGSTPNPSWYNPGGASFTDMVVIPSTTTGGAYTFNAATWKATAVVECEQSRGNLANITVLNASNGGATYLNNNPYKTQLVAALGQTAQQYWAYAAQNTNPSYLALSAGQNFVSTMNLSTDARFGLSTFADYASSPTLNTIAGPNYLISGAFGTWYPSPYTPGGQPSGGTFPLPWVSLSDGTPGSYNNAFAALAPPTSSYDPTTTTTQAVPTGQTNIWDALNNAIQDVTANGRTTARKAIVLFTDGIPTPPPGTPATIPAGNTNAGLFALAATCNAPNIPIYTIGLAQNADPTLVTAENTLLSGISSAGGSGGTYFPTTSASQLNAAFQAIARSLVLLRAGG
ncbi:MAG: VWA domain-containing protein [Candidatus Melainabacteria bacterium]|nr:MAG: VWA domain-containing protein [Candidatus Melainabacteria bacterium]